jgi:hypothetical protein
MRRLDSMRPNGRVNLVLPTGSTVPSAKLHFKDPAGRQCTCSPNSSIQRPLPLSLSLVVGKLCRKTLDFQAVFRMM